MITSLLTFAQVIVGDERASVLTFTESPLGCQIEIRSKGGIVLVRTEVHKSSRVVEHVIEDAIIASGKRVVASLNASGGPIDRARASDIQECLKRHEADVKVLFGIAGPRIKLLTNNLP